MVAVVVHVIVATAIVVDVVVIAAVAAILACRLPRTNLGLCLL